MADCPVCKEKKAFEDDKISIIKLPNGLLVVPKAHTPILEQVPDFVIDKMWVKANQELAQLFDKGLQGANLLINNGVAAGQAVPHFSMMLIERKENDGLFPMWATKKVSDEDMSSVEAKLKEVCQNIGVWEEEKSEVKEEKKEVKSDDSWMATAWRRVP